MGMLKTVKQLITLFAHYAQMLIFLLLKHGICIYNTQDS